MSSHIAVIRAEEASNRPATTSSQGVEAPQARKVWKAIEKACGWKHPKAPSVKHLWEDKATEAVLDLLRDTRVGCMVNVGRLPGEEGGEEGGGLSEEDGPGSP